MRVIPRPFPAAAAPVLAAALLAAAVLSAGPVTAVQAAPAAASTTYGELADNGTFTSGTTDWWNSANASIASVDGTLRASVGAGTVNPWDAVIG